MGKSTLVHFVICVLLACSFAAPCFGKARKKATPAPTQQTVISNVSGNSITVTDQKAAKTVTVTPLTEVMINGQKGSLGDLKPGMVVSLVLSSPNQASRIIATSKN